MSERESETKIEDLSTDRTVELQFSYGPVEHIEAGVTAYRDHEAVLAFSGDTLDRVAARVGIETAMDEAVADLLDLGFRSLLIYRYKPDQHSKGRGFLWTVHARPQGHEMATIVDGRTPEAALAEAAVMARARHTRIKTKVADFQLRNARSSLPENHPARTHIDAALEEIGQEQS